jgi:LPPG:FO 2-phospho-L-lactate transferase
MALNHVVVLVGGVGGAKLALGMFHELPVASLTYIVNNGDDMWHYGLRVCPDTDTLLYTLSGLVDPNNGWGISGDTTHMLDGLKGLGEEPWFGLKDRDLATHLLRTSLLREGKTLTEITGELAERLGIGATILPMSDTFVETKVHTQEHGTLDFQEYFVRYRWQPTVTGITYQGAEGSTISPQAAAAIAQADAIIIAPSNPWLSIAPILAVGGMREALLQRHVPRVAVTPIVGGQAVKGPTAKIMGELGIEVTPQSIIYYYGDVLTGFVYDKRDASPQTSLKTVAMDTWMKTDEDKRRLARDITAWIEQL